MPQAPRFLVKGGTTYRILSDQVGSVRLVVNATTGAVAQRIDYDAFGVVTQDTNPGFQPFGFAGGLADRDTGLVRSGARDYDPAVARWTSKDPIRFDGGHNAFDYAAADPVNLVDATGLAPLFGYGEALSFYGRTSLQGLAALADGAIPFADPFAGWAYDPCDSTLGGSRASGELVRDIELALGGATLLARTSWLYNSSLLGRSSWLLGRGNGLLNSNNYLRLGWGWRGSSAAGQNVLRLATGGPLRSGAPWARSAWNWLRHMDFF